MQAGKQPTKDMEQSPAIQPAPVESPKP